MADRDAITLSTARQILATGKTTKEQLVAKFDIIDDEPAAVSPQPSVADQARATLAAKGTTPEAVKANPEDPVAKQGVIHNVVEGAKTAMRTSIIPSVAAGFENMTDEERAKVNRWNIVPGAGAIAAVTSPGYKAGVKTLRETADMVDKGDKDSLSHGAGEMIGGVIGDAPVYALQPEIGAGVAARFGAKVGGKLAAPLVGKVVGYLAKQGMNVPVDIATGALAEFLKSGSAPDLEHMPEQARTAFLARTVMGLVHAKKEKPPSGGTPQTDAYVAEQTAAREAARTEGSPTGADKVTAAVRDLKTKFVDSTAPIEDTLAKAVKDNDIKLRPSADIGNQIDRTLRAPSLAGQWLKDSGFHEAVQSVPSVDHLDQFLIAKHALDLEALKSAAETKGEAAKYEHGRDIAKDAALVKDLEPVYGPAAAKVKEVSDKMLDYMVDAGLVSKKAAADARAKYPSYVPFDRVFSEAEGGASGGRASNAVASLSKQTVFQGRQGSKRVIENPLESIMSRANDAFVQGEKNKAARMLTSYSKLPGNPFGLEPVRTAKNVARRQQILGSLKELGQEQRATARAARTTKGRLAGTEESLARQVDAVQSRIDKTIAESDAVYEQARAQAADEFASPKVDAILERTEKRERRITELQKKINEAYSEHAAATKAADAAYSKAQAAAADGAPESQVNRHVDEGFSAERRAHEASAKTEQANRRFDEDTAQSFEQAYDQGDVQRADSADKLQEKGLRLERKAFELEGRKQNVEAGKTAQRRTALAADLRELRRLLAERSGDVKSLRTELFNRGDRKLGPGDSTISFLSNGIKETWKVSPEIARAAKSLDVKQLGVVERAIGVVARTFKVGTTGVNLPFVLSNLAKDQATAAVNSSRSFATSLANPVNFVRSVGEALGHGKLFDEVIREGGMSTSFDLMREQVPQTLKEIRAGRSTSSKIAFTVSHPAQLFRAVENIIARSEEVTRIQQYRGTYEAAIKEGMPPRQARIEAANAARNNTVNFARRGEWGGALNAVVPYLNAQIQGARTLVRAFRERPLETAGKVALTVSFPIMAATAWNLSDDKRAEAYDDIEDFEKEHNIIIVPPNPTKDENGRWNIIKIPMGQGIDELASPARRVVEAAAGRDPVKMREIASSLFNTVSPISPDQIAANGAPQMVKPLAEVAVNRDFFTKRDIVPKRLERLPGFAQVRPNTSGTARLIAKGINAVTPSDPSPLQVEHVMKGYFGGIAPQILNTSDRALAAMDIIPPDQIGGETTADASSRRFNKAVGGARSRKAREGSRRQ